MSTPVLGINFYAHDSSAALVVDGQIIAAAEEERFNRKKHTREFPRQAIGFCLQKTGLKLEDIGHVAISYQPHIQMFQRMLALRYWDKGFFWGPRATMSIFPGMLERRLQAEFKTQKLPRFRIHYVPHHRSHAASSFLASSFEEAAVLTADGAGEWTTTELSHWQKNTYKPLARISYPHSLGFFYGAFTQFLGFRPSYDEGKVMALAAYGTPDFAEKFSQIIRIQEDGSFRLNESFFDFHFSTEQWYKSRLAELLGPARKASDPITNRHEAIAATLQQYLEKIWLALACNLSRLTKSKKLCLAGGVALNCSANGKLLKTAPFDSIFVQPAAGDAGTSLGAALWVSSKLGTRRPDSDFHAYLGPSYSSSEIRDALKKSGLAFLEDDSQAIDQTAREIWNGKICGWFEGRMEFGPRALGARSILAAPGHPGMREKLNREIKFRESFRPFGAAVTEEDASRYFEIASTSPFMLFAVKMRPEFKALLPSALHVDGTCRIQTVSRAHQPRFWTLLKSYEKMSGMPILLNTSFNLKDEPLVCSPEDAVKTFLRSRLDFLMLEGCLVKHPQADRPGMDHSQIAASEARKS